MSTVSVIIATYGTSEWQRLANDRAVMSVIGQADGYDKLIPFHQPDGNRATSLNSAAADAPHGWLIFLDADDELAPGYVGAMRRALEQTGDGPVLFTPAVQHIRKGRPGAPAFMDRGISLRDDNWMVVGTMIHKDLFWEVGGFDDYPHGFEDWALWSKCYRIGAQIVKVPDAVYRYFHNPQSKHKQGWRDRKTQVATHLRVKAELDAWEAAL
jgi:glycosyltransferase involved in cell wall biosynthesis